MEGRQAAPSFDEIADQVLEIFNGVTREDLKRDLPLIAEQGVDSLDMTEAAFDIEDRFGIEFPEREPLLELSKRLPPDTVVTDQILTPRGRDILFERMPELRSVSLPEDIGVYAVSRYWTVETFARLVFDVFSHMMPKESSDLPSVWVGHGFVDPVSGEPVEPTSSEELLDRWLDQKVAEELGG
jgi:acyl carrier protein